MEGGTFDIVGIVSEVGELMQKFEEMDQRIRETSLMRDYPEALKCLN